MPPSTRKAADFKLKNLIGPGKEFLPREVPTLRAVIQKGILIQEKLVIEEEKSRHLLSTCKLSEVLACEVHSNITYSRVITVKFSVLLLLFTLWVL